MATFNAITNKTSTLTVTSFGAGVVTSNAAGVLASSNSLSVTGTIGAGGSITSSAGDIVSTIGQVTAGTSVSAGTTVIAGTSIGAGTTITAGTGITSTTGDIVATAGQVNAGTSITATTTVTSTTTMSCGTGLTVLAGGITSTGTTTLNSLTAGVMQTSAAGVVSSTNGANGQLLIGGGATPAWANLTSAGGTLAITNGANTINLEVVGAPGIVSFVSDAGTATPALAVLNVLGGSNIGTTGAGNTLTVNLDNTVSISGTFTANGDITSTNGDITSTIGNLIAGAGVSAVTNIVTSTGNVVATAGQVNAGTTMTAGSGVTSTTGNVSALAGNIALPATTAALSGVITFAGIPYVHEYGSHNIFVGETSGNFTLAGTSNSGFGYLTLSDLANGDNNTSVGGESGRRISTGDNNTSIGQGSLDFVTTGSGNVAVGYNAGSAHTVADSNNIDIDNVGVVAETGVTRIGTTGVQTECHVAGVYNAAIGATAGVVSCDTVGQLGSSNGANGQVLIGGGTAPTWANITSAGATVAITNGANTINLETLGVSNWAGGVSTWTDIVATPQALAANNGYYANRGAGNVVFTLPGVCAISTVIRIVGIQNGWSVTQAAGQQVHFGNQSTTAGAGGSLASSHARDCIEMVCIVANTTWQIISSIGNITIV